MKKLLFCLLPLWLLFSTVEVAAQLNEKVFTMPFSNGSAVANGGPDVLNGNSGHRLVATRFENWDSIPKAWVGTDSMHYFYTQENLLDRVENYQYSGGKWVNNMKEAYSYDTNKNRLFLLRQRWNGTGWMDDSRVIYAYDSYNNRLVAQNQSWSDSVWKDVTRSLYEYDSHHNRTKWTRQKPQNNAWLNQLRYIYQYDAAQKRTTQITQAWDINSSNWDNVQHIAYAYNSAGLQQEELVRVWKDSLWTNNLRATPQYGTDGLMENIVRAIWQNNGWNVYSQNLYEYHNGNLTRLAEHDWSGNSWKNNTLFENAYDVHNNQTFQRYSVGKGIFWQNVQQIFSYYEESSVGIPVGVENGLDFSVGPNPGTGVFTVRYSNPVDRLKRVQIVDVKGNLVLELPLSGSDTEIIDMSQLPDGNYQLWLTTQQGKEGTKQVIKIK